MDLKKYVILLIIGFLIAIGLTIVVVNYVCDKVDYSMEYNSKEIYK